MNQNLTLKQIAFEWARELEDERVPGRPSEQEIFANLVSAVRRGEFGSGPFKIQRTSRAKWRRSVGPDGQGIYEINPPYLCNLDDLRKGVQPASGKGGLPWDERDVEDDDPLSVRAFWKKLFLSKQKIGQRCDERGETRPRFWFEDIEENPDPTRSGLAGRPTSKHLYIAEMKRRAAGGRLQDSITQEARDLWDWMDQKHPELNRGRVKSIENAIRDDYRRLQADKASEATAGGIK